MKAEKISLIISEICAKLGINYSSVNPHALQMINDAKRLGEIILEINSLTDELDCILVRHNVGIFTKNQIQKDLKELHEIDHDLINLAQKIKNENA